jgi:hypothetical protein
MIGWSGFDSRMGLGIFLFDTMSSPALRPTQPPIQWVAGAFSLGIKRPDHEADHSPPSSAEVKECVELYHHSPIRLHGVVFSWAQGQLYLTFHPPYLKAVSAIRNPTTHNAVVTGTRIKITIKLLMQVYYIRCIRKIPDWVDNEITTINTRWEATQRVMAAKLTRLTHKIAIKCT